MGTHRHERTHLGLVFAAALLLYTLTLAPTVVWGDSAELATAAYVGDAAFGSANAHPLFVGVGRLFTLLPGDVARNVNLAAAVFGALAVTLVYRVARRLGASRAGAWTGAAALAVSHAFWLHAVVAEVYTANAFFVAAIINLLVEWTIRRQVWWLAAAAAAFAVGLTNHLVLATLAPAAIVFVAMNTPRPVLTSRSLTWAGALALVLIGAVLVARAPLAAAAAKIWYGPPGVSEYLALRFELSLIAKEAAYYVAYLIYQFPSIALPLGVIGAFALWRDQRKIAVLLLMAIGVNAAIFIRHTVWGSGGAGGAKFVFYIADYVVFAVLCAAGAEVAVRRFAAGRSGMRLPVASVALLAAVAVVPPLVYVAAPPLSYAVGIDLVRARALPYRDNSRFFLTPGKRGETGARRFGEEALELANAGAVIFADHTPYTVLRYLQVVEGRRPDVLIYKGPVYGGRRVPVRWMLESGRRRPTYLAAATPGYYDLNGLTGAYDLVPAGSIIEVRPRDVQ